jgi:hypothetical protein
MLQRTQLLRADPYPAQSKGMFSNKNALSHFLHQGFVNALETPPDTLAPIHAHGAFCAFLLM